MSNPVQYLGILLSRSAQKSVLLTDRLTIMLVPFATLGLWLFGAKMTDSLQETMLLGVAITVVAVVTLRLIAASYFVWKDDRTEIKVLKNEINSDLFKESSAFHEHRISLRKELADKLAWLITFAEYATVPETHKLAYQDTSIEVYLGNIIRAREIISQLSYDVILRVTALNLISLCGEIIKLGPNNAEEKRWLSRLWAQRKLTFKLLHRQDIHEIYTLAEVELLIADFGENFDGEGEPPQETLEYHQTMDELKSMIVSHGPLLSENRDKLRSAMRGSRSR